VSSNSDRKSVRFVNLLAIVAVVAWCSSSPIRADIVTFKVTGGILSGTIGTTNFTDDPYTITAIGNSAGIFYGPPGDSAMSVSYSLSLQGVGTTPIAGGYVLLYQGPASLYLNGQGSLDFMYNDAPFELGGAAGPVFDTWNFVSPIGPVPASAGFEDSDGGLYSYYTALFGELYASGSSGNQVLTVTSTPEPAMFVVCGLGISLLLAIAHRRRRRCLAEAA
jgi:hypothetical protein